MLAPVAELHLELYDFVEELKDFWRGHEGRYPDLAKTLTVQGLDTYTRHQHFIQINESMKRLWSWRPIETSVLTSPGRVPTGIYRQQCLLAPV